MAKETALAKIQAITAKNPYTGTAEQIVNLSLGIFEASGLLSKSTFSLYKDGTGINEKIFSKLKVIGRNLQELTDDERRDVVKALPPSYSTIHNSVRLVKELVTGARSSIHPLCLSAQQMSL